MTINHDRLMRLRLVIARIGEMDCARWWNTKGQLGRMGAMTVGRGFPRTQRFARARSVFAVATERCRSHFDMPSARSLWKLPPKIEDEFDASWGDWLNDEASWRPLFERLEDWQGDDVLAALDAARLLPTGLSKKLSALRIDDNGRGVLVSTPDVSDDVGLILGMPRSGSTLVEQILAGHPAVAAAGELDAFSQTVGAVLGARFPADMANLAAADLRRVGTAYLDTVHGATGLRNPAAVRFTDKMPVNFVGSIRNSY